MLSERFVKTSLHANTVQKYCGMKWEDGNPVMITDKVPSKFVKDANGKNSDGFVYTPARWFNYTYAVWQIMGATKTKKITKDILVKAVHYVEENCLDTAGNPRNVADEMFKCSYSKLLESMQHDFQKYEY